jgi:hypothetical protein
MKKAFWKYPMERRRWMFWAWMMEHYPRLYHWCDKVLPFNTLPF